MARKLRIAVSVVFGVLTVALCVLWVRSHWRGDYVRHYSGRTSATLTDIQSSNGFVRFLRVNDRGRGVQPHTIWKTGFFVPSGFVPDDWYAVDKFTTTLYVPYGLMVTVAAASAAIPWANPRFSLRGLLIATTLVAVVLGLAVWAGR